MVRTKRVNKEIKREKKKKDNFIAVRTEKTICFLFMV